MSLVAYEDSDCETDEDNSITDDVENPPTKDDVKTKFNKPFLMLPEPKSSTNTKMPDDCYSVENENSLVTLKKALGDSIQEKLQEPPLFPTLPKPKTGGKIKIIIPSLNEFYDDDDDYQPKRKMIKPSNNGCGLFSILPDVKNKKSGKVSTTLSMIPRATMCKISHVKDLPRTTEIKCFEPKSVEVLEEVDDDDKDDIDFLGLNKIDEMPDVAPIDGFDVPLIKTETIKIIEDDKVYGPVFCPESTKSDLYEDNETTLILDSNALKQLGDREKTHIKQVDVINVNMSQVLEESQQWMSKNISEEYAEGKKAKDEIHAGGQSKRKHQITYLAQQAKANELKLKNMWAENRLTRKQTQAKYGF
ncbi:Proline-rich protein PRCC [Cinara cedri]|uniref:Proline-rich protein PRCC n=1 Tax=Cinara cedri TaxID=506608 RepID=A0A5E4MPM2_9HEMI|nr:Proline-rich protein PRCC [Cinara cedri]